MDGGDRRETEMKRKEGWRNWGGNERRRTREKREIG